MPRASPAQSAAEPGAGGTSEGLAGTPLPEGSAGRAGSVVAVEEPPETAMVDDGADDGIVLPELPEDDGAPPEPPLGGEAGALPLAGTDEGGPPPCEPLLPWARALPETQSSESSRISTRDMTASRGVTCHSTIAKAGLIFRMD